MVRRFVADFYANLHDESVGSRGLLDEWTSQISLATHELVENAICHGRGDGEFSVTVEFDPDRADRLHTVCLTTRNRATEQSCERVRSRVLDLQLRSPEDLFEFYLELMGRSTSTDGSCGLGLARVRVEAQMELDCSFDGDDLVVTARASIHTGASR